MGVQRRLPWGGDEGALRFPLRSVGEALLLPQLDGGFIGIQVLVG